MRSILVATILGSQALALVNAAVQGRHLKDFIDRTPVLETPLDLEKFKGIAARQMVAALAQACLLVIAPICFFWGLFTGHLSAEDFIWILLPSVIVILVALSYRKVEKQTWSLPAPRDDIRAERDRVVHTWKSKALPDW